jgi:DNA polymerase/3'-5' exonuclease PolX
MSLLFNVSFIKKESEKTKINNRTYVKIDFFRFTKKDYVFQLNYLTGSKKFNILMRKQAQKLGYLLNQKGLFKDGADVPVKNERELFSLLGMKFATPEQRNI